MRIATCATLTTFLLFGTPAFADDAEKESHCKKAVEVAVKMLNDTPTKSDRDKADKASLQNRIDQMLAEKRASKATYCEIWVALNQIAAKL